MATRKAKPAPRKPRADALRNRDRILLELCTVTSRRATPRWRPFTGLRWRNWPRRSGNSPRQCFPSRALRAWILLFVDYIAARQLIAPALNTLVGRSSKAFEAARHLVKGAIDPLVQRASESGDIRPDLDPFDLLRALSGVSNVASAPDWPQSAKRLVHILIAGSRPAA
jgi:hypothetical protein